MNHRHIRNIFAALGVAAAITSSADAYWYCTVSFPC